MLIGHAPGDGTMRFRFSPKDAKTYRFAIHGNVPALDGQTLEITAVAPPPTAAGRPSEKHPNWWTDDLSPEFASGPHPGTRTVSRWREDFLGDFAIRTAVANRPPLPNPIRNHECRRAPVSGTYPWADLDLVTTPPAHRNTLSEV